MVSSASAYVPRASAYVPRGIAWLRSLPLLLAVIKKGLGDVIDDAW